MRVSIIVPVYNMASDDRLTWCLDSLLRQKTLQGYPLEDYEILAVDDCSTDGSAELLDRYAQRFPGRLRVFHGDRNRHQGGAKNLGLAHARGEWISFIDADDWVADTYCAQLLKKAEETGADCVGTDYCIVHSHTMEPGPVIANSRAEQAGAVNEARRRSLLVDFGSLCVKIYRREIVYGDSGEADGNARERTAGCRIFPEDIFYEDNAVVKTWVMRIRHFEYLPGPLYYYYQHEDSTVHTVSLRRLENRLASGRLMVGEARRGGYLEDYRREIEYSFTVLFYKNTVFGALQSLHREEWKRYLEEERGKGQVPAYRSVYAFVTAVGQEMKGTFPDFQENPYYLERTDAEERRLIALQMASPRRFYLYYRALWFYRGLRYGKGS